MANTRVGVLFEGKDQGVTSTTNKTTNALNKLGKKSDSTSKRMKTSWKSVALGIGAAVLAINQIKNGIDAALGSYAKQITADKKLEAALKATKYQVGLTADEMRNMAKELSNMTGIADETIITAQGLLTTFTKIGKETFPKALEAAADMSAMFGQDMQQSVIQLGTALNDPIAGVGRLRRIGISFTETQKDMIKNFVDMGDITSAQNVILSELNNEFGGVAEALGSSFVGKLNKLGNKIEDLVQLAVERLLPAFNGFLDIATNVVDTFTEMLTPAKDLTDEINAMTFASSKLGQELAKIDFNADGLMEFGRIFIDASLGENINTVYKKMNENIQEITDNVNTKWITGSQSVNELLLRMSHTLNSGALGVENTIEGFTGWKTELSRIVSIFDTLIESNKGLVNQANYKALVKNAEAFRNALLGIDDQQKKLTDGIEDYNNIVKFIGDTYKSKVNPELIKMRDLTKQVDLLENLQKGIGPLQGTLTEFQMELYKPLEELIGKDFPDIVSDVLQTLKGELDDLKETLEGVDLSSELSSKGGTWQKDIKKDESDKQDVEQEKTNDEINDFVGSLLSGLLDVVKWLTDEFISLITSTEVFQNAMAEFNAILTDVVEFAVVPLIKALKPLFTIVIALVSVLANLIVPLFDALGQIILSLTPVFIVLGKIIIEATKVVVLLLPPILSLISIILNGLAPVLELLAVGFSILGSVIEFLTPIFDLLGFVLRVVMTPIAALGAFFTWLGNIVYNFGKFLGNFINNLFDPSKWGVGLKETDLGKLISDAVSQVWNTPSASGLTSDLSNIPEFNSDLIFGGTGDDTQFERAGGMFGGDTTVQRAPDIYVQQYFNGPVIGQAGNEEVGAFVVQAIQAYLGSGGRVEWLEV